MRGCRGLGWVLVLVLGLWVGCGSDDSSEEDDWDMCEEEAECPGNSTLLEEEECPSGAQCEEIEVCDETRYCLLDDDCDAVPECPPASRSVEGPEACDDEEDCFSTSMCGVTIWCEHYDTCEDLSCPSGTNEVESEAYCPDDGGLCQEVAEDGCEETIWCHEPPPETCDAVPVCPPGSTEGECPDEEGVDCWEETLCDTTIPCFSEPSSNGGDCDEVPQCPMGANEGECPGTDDVMCWEEEACGEVVECYEFVSQCTAYPVCPPGTQEVDSCEDMEDDECWPEEMCGYVIYCHEASM